jgi:predicted nucleic-acid-binding protein
LLPRVGPGNVKISVDTNVLVRAMTGDDAVQSAIAKRELAQAETVAVAASALCELVWVLGRAYGVATADIAAEIRHLISTSNVEVDCPVVEAGLALLEAGGDFADGVIAHEGRWLGAETFVSFDRKAVELMRSHGQPARLPAE